MGMVHGEDPVSRETAHETMNHVKRLLRHFPLWQT